MYHNYNPYNNDGDRFFPLFPFILGGIGGAAIVGASRPRPVFVRPPAPYYGMPMPYGSPYPYGYNYNYYGGYNYY